MFLGENMQVGSRTIYEYFVLEEILDHCQQRSFESSVHNISAIYNATKELCKGLDIAYSLRPKEEKDIKTFLKEHEHVVEAFKCLVTSRFA